MTFITVINSSTFLNHSVAVDLTGTFNGVLHGNVHDAYFVETSTLKSDTIASNTLNGNIILNSDIIVHSDGKMNWISGIQIGNSFTMASLVNSIAIGKNSIAGSAFGQGISIGYNAITKGGRNNLAIGGKSYNSAEAGTVYGGSISIGYLANISPSCHYGISIGSGHFGGQGINAGPLVSNTNSIAIGRYCHTVGASAIALGYHARASSTYSVAIGRLTSSSAIAGVALGHSSSVGGIFGVAIGSDCDAQNQAVAIGRSAYAKDYSVAVGQISVASGLVSVAVGANSRSTGDNSIAIGRDSKATMDSGVSIGHGVRSYADRAIAFGYQCAATQQETMAIGINATASYLRAFALGWNTNATSHASVAIGTGAQSLNTFSLSCGTNAVASGYKSVAFGPQTVSSADHSLAIGSSAQALNSNAIAIGTGAVSTGPSSIAIGTNTSVSGTGNVCVLDPSDTDINSIAKVWGQVFQKKSWSDGFTGVAKIDTTGNMYKEHIDYERIAITVSDNPYTPPQTVQIIGVDSSIGAITINLPQISSLTLSNKRMKFMVVDEGGVAGTNNITINASGEDTILGSNGIILNADYNTLNFYNDSVDKWYVY